MQKCKWVSNVPINYFDDGKIKTSCGKLANFVDENYKFCPFCGGEMELTSQIELRPISKDADLVSREEWVEDNGYGFGDDDGSGYLATATHESRIGAHDYDLSDPEVEPWVTHVAWYNK